jgi:trehalose 2-sulfotransferase
MTPQRSYIVASSPRTGSYLLCEGLEATGIAGRPTEVFSPEFQDIWCRRWALGPTPTFDKYLEAAIRHGTTGNGVYGLKIHWMHVNTLASQAGYRGYAAGVLEQLFPGAAYVRIVRRDRRAQALSFFRARATNEWWRIEGVKNEQSNGHQPVFDDTTILALEAQLAQQDLAWDRHFRECGIQALMVEYEALVADYYREVARVLRFLGLDEETARAIPPPRLVRQADALTEEWRQLLEKSLARQDQSHEIAP